MSIKNIPNVKFISDSHRCYNFILDFVVSTASIGSYLSAYHNLPVTTFAPTFKSGIPQHQTCDFQGLSCGKSVSFVPDDVLRSVFVDGLRNEPIPYIESNNFPIIKGVSTPAIAEMVEGLAQAMFTRYWETNLAQIEIVHGKRSKGSWPMVLQFAAIVRDAMSHGGKIHMFPSVSSANYFGLTFSQADNGKKIIHTLLTCADIFYLMLDIDNSF